MSRMIFESAIWSEPTDITKLFIWLLGNARHNEIPQKYPHCTINRGELITSLNQICEDNQYYENRLVKQWSRQKCSRMLTKLQQKKYIAILADTYGTHIKVCNYEFYQDPNNYIADSNETIVQQQRDNSVTTAYINNNVNNVKNVKKEKIYMVIPEIEFVRLSRDDYDKLIEKIGEDKTNEMIERLDNYIGSKGLQKKYKSHYRTILNWIDREKEKEEPKEESFYGLDKL